MVVKVKSGPVSGGLTVLKRASLLSNKALSHPLKIETEYSPSFNTLKL